MGSASAVAAEAAHVSRVLVVNWWVTRVINSATEVALNNCELIRLGDERFLRGS